MGDVQGNESSIMKRQGTQQQIMSEPSEPNVNWDFIEMLEGSEVRGYVPKNKDGTPHENSGVTIGSGVDLKQRTYQSLIDIGVSESTANKLKPYLGKSGKDASKIASKLNLSNKEVSELNKAVKKSESKTLVKAYEEDSGNKFNDLTEQQQTVVMSVGFQYGNLKKRTPNFWGAVTSGDWVGVKKELENFGDDFSTRRKKEADYLGGNN